MVSPSQTSQIRRSGCSSILNLVFHARCRSHDSPVSSILVVSCPKASESVSPFLEGQGQGLPFHATFADMIGAAEKLFNPTLNAALWLALIELEYPYLDSRQKDDNYDEKLITVRALELQCRSYVY